MTIRERVHHGFRQAIHIALSPYRAFKAICFLVGLSVVSATLVLAAGAYIFYRSTPDLTAMDFAQARALAGTRVHERLENKNVAHPWVALKDVSHDFLYSIVMSEDATFFEHHGVNFDAMVNSLAENLKRREAAFGGSTITQQVAKNLFLSQEKSPLRKLRELLLTRRLEHRFTKNQILELYLNVAEFGPDIFGAEAAARRYFKKSPAEINALEGAFIAVMLPSPKRYHYAVVENHNLAPSKRKKIRRVLTDMVAHEFISDEQYRGYLKQSRSGRFLADIGE